MKKQMPSAAKRLRSLVDGLLFSDDRDSDLKNLKV